ncbi:MAG: ABC transporter substrate-binding protein [Myxococcota bacterium]
MARLRIALEWFLNPDHVPFLIALDRGWFAEVGLDVELVEPVEHFDAFEAMEAGTIDVAVTEPIHLLQDVAKGQGLVGFARFLHTNGGVMYFEESGITRPAHMAGKRVQYPGAPGPGGPAIINTMIRADGGEPGELIPVNNGFLHTDALVDGKADLATLAFYNFEVVEARHRGFKANFFALKDWGVPDFCQLILICQPSLLASRRQDLLSLVRVLGRGIDACIQEPEAAREVYFRHTKTAADDPLMSAIYAATVPCFTHDLSMCRAYYQHLGAWLVETEQCDVAPTFDEVWTNALAVR